MNSEREAGTIELSTHGRQVWIQSREDLGFPFISDYGEGRYGMLFTRGRHAGGEWLHSLVSEDGGQTWRDDPALKDPRYRRYFIIRRRDGTLFGVPHGVENRPGGSGPVSGVFVETIASCDNGRSWSRSWEPIIGVGGAGKSGAPRNLPLELPDGYLLQLFQCPSRAHPGKHESLLLEQSPDETCWRVRANVFGEHPETDEGASEASLARLANGRIVSATRTGYPDSPMLWAFSDDHGVTWSEAVALPWSGVQPMLYQLQNGALLLVSGARRAEKLTGVHSVVGSSDGGESWSEPYVFYDGPGCSYVTAVVTGPGSLLVVYAESQFRRLELPQFTSPGQYNKICAVTLEATLKAQNA